MSALEKLTSSVQIPDLYHVSRAFKNDSIADVDAAVRAALDACGLAARLPQGGNIAVGVGSRGIGRIPEIVHATVAWFKDHGTRPFVIPCMGSHGGATAEGQIGMLAHLGVTEASAGCPVKASMDVVQRGCIDNGMPVYMDAMAAAADGIFVINRVKPHTSFTGCHESGIVKMLTIGLGKQRGAESCHVFGFGPFPEFMPKMAQLILDTTPTVLGALAIVENSLDKPCLFEGVLHEHIVERDAALLEYARTRIGTLPMNTLDVLLVHQLGKNIAGSGMDPNVTGRASTPYKKANMQATRIGVLRLTPESNGNATGIGLSDVTTKKLADEIDFDYMYANVLTATVVKAGFLPIIAPTDELALRALIMTCNAGQRPLRLAYIRDTLKLDSFWVSQAVAEELKARSDCTVADKAEAFLFSKAGELLAPAW